MMHKNRSVDVHDFAMIPKADIPRSSFRMQHVHKTSFDGGYLVPIYVDEMLPGDTFNMRLTAFVRLATPIFPTMDNLHCDTFFFFVPNRLVWTHWINFMGEQANPGDSIAYTIPTITSPAGGFAVRSVMDYMGLPTVGGVGAGLTVTANSLPLRGYNLIYDKWFRDQNLQPQPNLLTGDSGDTASIYPLLKRCKRHDYFTGCLPFLQKGTAVGVPLGGFAPVVSTNQVFSWVSDTAPTEVHTLGKVAASTGVIYRPVGTPPTVDGEARWAPPGLGVTGLQADLSGATAATVNAIRLAFQVQKLLERDARGGTRYTEIVRSHFGVVSPDARLQRPEYIGGGSTPIVINPIAQTSATTADGTDTPQGNLSAVGTGLAQSGFSYSATEHGYVIGLVNVRADLTYQQGMRRMWNRSTRYDFYFPVFAMLGEQAVLTKELYANGNPAIDDDVFGYQERWAEYRYFPSMITSLMRSTSAGSIDAWHYSQEFFSQPFLNALFIEDATDEVVQRATAVGSAANGQQFIFDGFFDCKAARPLPMYSVPGMIDHF